MGRVFLDHPGGTRIYSCANCDTPLTNRTELVSTRFTGATGRAFLFNKVVNLIFSEVENRIMLTGRHIVRDVSCKNCGTRLGWIYVRSDQHRLVLYCAEPAVLICNLLFLLQVNKSMSFFCRNMPLKSLRDIRRGVLS